jgi:hypothetical protein
MADPNKYTGKAVEAGLGAWEGTRSAWQHARHAAKALIAKLKSPKTMGPKIGVGEDIGAEDWLKKGVWVSVASSNVAGIHYKANHKLLFVEFLSGRVYAYRGVPSGVAKSMFVSNSMGRFVHRNLKNKYLTGRLK